MDKTKMHQSSLVPATVLDKSFEKLKTTYKFDKYKFTKPYFESPFSIDQNHSQNETNKCAEKKRIFALRLKSTFNTMTFLTVLENSSANVWLKKKKTSKLKRNKNIRHSNAVAAFDFTQQDW